MAFILISSISYFRQNYYNVMLFLTVIDNYQDKLVENDLHWVKDFGIDAGQMAK